MVLVSPYLRRDLRIGDRGQVLLHHTQQLLQRQRCILTHTRASPHRVRGVMYRQGDTPCLPPRRLTEHRPFCPVYRGWWRTCSGKSASTPLIASQCSLMHVPTCATAAAGTWGTGWPRRFPPPAPRVPLLRVCFFSEPIFQTRSASSRQLLSGTRHIGTMFIITYVFKAWNRKTGCSRCHFKGRIARSQVGRHLMRVLQPRHTSRSTRLSTLPS